MAPEVLAGSHYDRAADVYAFGIILWEILTWQIPWDDRGPWQVAPFLPRTRLVFVFFFCLRVVIAGGWSAFWDQVRPGTDAPEAFGRAMYGHQAICAPATGVSCMFQTTLLFLKAACNNMADDEPKKMPTKTVTENRQQHA